MRKLLLNIKLKFWEWKRDKLLNTQYTLICENCKYELTLRHKDLTTYVFCPRCKCCIGFFGGVDEKEKC